MSTFTVREDFQRGAHLQVHLVSGDDHWVILDEMSAAGLYGLCPEGVERPEDAGDPELWEVELCVPRFYPWTAIQFLEVWGFDEGDGEHNDQA